MKREAYMGAIVIMFKQARIISKRNVLSGSQGPDNSFSDYEGLFVYVCALLQKF